MSDKNEGLRQAITAAGGLAKLAEPLGISVQAISQWDEVPPLRVLAVERVSGGGPDTWNFTDDFAGEVATGHAVAVALLAWCGGGR